MDNPVHQPLVTMDNDMDLTGAAAMQTQPLSSSHRDEASINASDIRDSGPGVTRNRANNLNRNPNSDTEKRRQQFTRRKTKERRIKRLLTLEEIFEAEPVYPIYHVIKFPGVDIESELNVIAADADIKKQIGQAKKISKINKNTLLVEIANEAQYDKLRNIKTIDKNPVVIEEHKSLNQVKGTIYSETMSKSTIEEIFEKLKDQGVSKVERMKKKVDGKLIETHRYVITFKKTKLPSLIKLADWHRELVDLYIPTPLRCNRCQKLGHTKNWC